ncbi:MAG: response regulator [Lentisphaerae bacterium]|nr:response regulator [Lentisphaerota bacterium]
MTRARKAPEPLRTGPSQDRIVVDGIALTWNAAAGTFDFLGLPAAMLWVNSTLAGLMSGLATMVGPERFSLALQSEGRKSVESDWLLMIRYPSFPEGFAAIGVVAAVAGWGQWRLVADDPEKRECRFEAHNTWEGLYQKTLNTCWGSAMLAGKLAGYCTKRFGTNCWATQTSFIARGDACDAFTVAPSTRMVENEIEQLLSTDRATRADMAVALGRLRTVKSQLLANQESLETQVRQRTEELAASLSQVTSINDRLQREVVEHTRAEEARKQSEDLQRKLLELAPLSMAIVGHTGTIEYINQKAIETFGYRPDDIPTMDQWWVKAYPDPDYRSEVTARWMRHVKVAMTERREIARDDYRVTCKDGAVKTVTIFGIVVADKVLVMFDDITMRALREDLLRQSNLDLERRVQERTSELAKRNVALERTTALLRQLGAKLAQVEDLERKRIAHILHDQLQQLLVAANFSISALERGLTDGGQLSAARAAGMAVSEAIQESRSLVLELSPPILREGGLALAMKWIQMRMLEKHKLRVAAEVDERVQAAGEDLRIAIFHAVRELLLNVVKHSGVSTAEVTITVLQDDQVQVVVGDRGRGYAPLEQGHPEDLELGFGQLAVRERFEALGGRMTVDSAPGAGCRVTLTAPMTAPRAAFASGSPDGRTAPVRDPGGRPAGEEGAPVVGGKIRVLLVDDHMILRQGLMDYLARDPAIEVVGEASDGEAAIQVVRSLRPEVVLMDVSMPNMNGIDATRVIHSEYPAVVVIGLSMYAEPHREEEMRHAGAAAYVSKSEAAEVLVATIHACCGR